MNVSKADWKARNEMGAVCLSAPVTILFSLDRYGWPMVHYDRFEGRGRLDTAIGEEMDSLL